ncbi:MAG: transporter substrate-binding protein [Bradyrhizobium sp.]|nr:transporter substrate-binding protein [Bradyrhizobium sp.]
MRRRDFLTIFGAAAALAPLASGGQQLPIRRLGVLFVYGEDHPEVPSLVGALREGLRTHGWIEGQTLQMELRFCRSDAKLVQRYTDELVSLKPNVIFAQGVVGAAAMKQATQTIPVVFVQVQDPVGGGFVANLARPEGNLTGFTNFEYSIVGKWLQLLKDVSPGASRVMPMINPDNRPRWSGYTAAFEKYAPALGMKPQMAGVHSDSDIERVIAQFAEQPNGGLVVLPDATTGVHAKLIISLSERYRLPAVYSYGFYARAGGLIAYSDSSWGQFRSAASYIDRVFRGAKIGELPIQATDRFETVINLKTAAKLGITIPPTLLATADDLIE